MLNNYQINTKFLFVCLILSIGALRLVLSNDEVEREDSLEVTTEFSLNNNDTTGAEERDYSTNDSNEDKHNSTDDYDYGEELEDRDETECDNNSPSFLDKWRTVYDQGKNISINKHVKHINDTSNVLKTMRSNLEFLLKPSDNGIGRYKAIEFFSEIDLGLSSECLTAFTRVVMAISNGEIWALKFLDSIGRPLSSGFAEGIQSHFGEYEECLHIESPQTNDRNVIKGQYCMMKVIMPFPSAHSYDEKEPVEPQMYSGLLEHYNLVKLSTVRGFIEALNLSNGTIYRMGICIPSVCSAHEFQHLLNKLLFPVTRIPLEVGPQCHVKDETKSLDKYQIISISLLSISTILIIISTCYDIYIENAKQNNNKKIINEKYCENTISNANNDLLTSFSIIRNTRSLFAKNTKFAALDTFRLLFIINVHMGHAYTYTTSLGLFALKKTFSQVMYKVYEDNKYIFVRNPLIIDALFTLSGFLLSFGVLRKLDKTKGRFNYLEFIFQRWLRFFVLMFGALLFFYLFPLFGDGPIWDVGVGWVVPGCQNPSNLLKMLFFVHNFRDDLKEQLTIANSKCNPPTWFLSSLLQLTLIGPIFIIIYYRKRLYGLIAITGAILVSVFASIAPQILFNLKPYLQIWELESVIFSVSKSYTWYHFTPNNYGTGFFVGILFGYLLFNQSIRITRVNSTLFWLLSIFFCTTIYFWHNTFWRLDSSAPLMSVLLWTSLGKLFFTLSFGWIYFACCTGRGGYLNSLLSWHGFQPIARLSFGIYILHYLVVMHRIFTNHYTYVMTDKYMFEHLVIDLIYDTLLAFIFYLLFESPFFNIFSYLFSPKTIVVSVKVSDDSDNMNNNSHEIKSNKEYVNESYQSITALDKQNSYNNSNNTKL